MMIGTLSSLRLDTPSKSEDQRLVAAGAQNLAIHLFGSKSVKVLSETKLDIDDMLKVIPGNLMHEVALYLDLLTLNELASVFPEAVTEKAIINALKKTTLSPVHIAQLNNLTLTDEIVNLIVRINKGLPEYAKLPPNYPELFILLKLNQFERFRELLLPSLWKTFFGPSMDIFSQVLRAWDEAISEPKDILGKNLIDWGCTLNRQQFLNHFNLLYRLFIENIFKFEVNINKIILKNNSKYGEALRSPWGFRNLLREEAWMPFAAGIQHKLQFQLSTRQPIVSLQDYPRQIADAHFRIYLPNKDPIILEKIKGQLDNPDYRLDLALYMKEHEVNILSTAASAGYLSFLQREMKTIIENNPDNIYYDLIKSIGNALKKQFLKTATFLMETFLELQANGKIRDYLTVEIHTLHEWFPHALIPLNSNTTNTFLHPKILELFFRFLVANHFGEEKFNEAYEKIKIYVIYYIYITISERSISKEAISEEFVKLEKCGISIKEIDPLGNNVLHLAIQTKELEDEEFIELLMEQQISPHAKNQRGHTSLHEAIANGAEVEFIEAVYSLISRSIDKVHASFSRDISHFASLQNHEDIKSYFLTQDSNGDTLLHIALDKGNGSAVASYLHHYDIKLRDIPPNNSGETLIHLAIRNKAIDVLRLLLIEAENIPYLFQENHCGIMPWEEAPPYWKKQFVSIKEIANYLRNKEEKFSTYSQEYSQKSQYTESKINMARFYFNWLIFINFGESTSSKNLHHSLKERVFWDKLLITFYLQGQHKEITNKWFDADIKSTNKAAKQLYTYFKDQPFSFFAGKELANSLGENNGKLGRIYRNGPK